MIAVVLIFRRNLAQQVDRLSAVKAGGAELVFAERVDKVVRDSADLNPDLANRVSAERQAVLLQMASTDPDRAIRAGWEAVREVAQGQARQRKLPWTTTKDFVEDLHEAGELDRSAVQLVLDLRSLRYDLADLPEVHVSAATATAYVTAASSVAARIGSLSDGH